LPADAGVFLSGANKLTCLSMKFNILQEWNGETWEDVSAPLDIIGYFYIEKRNGELNSYTIDNLMEVFPWDGRDPYWFEDCFDQVKPVAVSITCEFESYGGKNRLKVRYLNPPDSVGPGGVEHSTPDSRRAVNAKLAAKLRAHSPPKTTETPHRKRGPEKRTSDADEAWNALVKRAPDGTTQAQLDSAWASILRVAGGGKAEEDFRPEDWGTALTEAEKFHFRPVRSGKDTTADDADFDKPEPSIPF